MPESPTDSLLIQGQPEGLQQKYFCTSKSLSMRWVWRCHEESSRQDQVQTPLSKGEEMVTSNWNDRLRDRSSTLTARDLWCFPSLWQRFLWRLETFTVLRFQQRMSYNQRSWRDRWSGVVNLLPQCGMKIWGSASRLATWDGSHYYYYCCCFVFF